MKNKTICSRSDVSVSMYDIDSMLHFIFLFLLVYGYFWGQFQRRVAVAVTSGGLYFQSVCQKARFLSG